MIKWIVHILYFHIYIPVYFFIVYFRDLSNFKKNYGHFEWLDSEDVEKYELRYDKKSVTVCTLLDPEIVRTIRNLGFTPKRILLDGDNKRTAASFKAQLNLSEAKVITVGIQDEYDFEWNFEDDPPQKLPKDFDLIVSHAMFEHLINPYKHLEDLSTKLKVGGVIIIQTHLPGFTYHRYPIDAVRFFPDWFERSAAKLKLNVCKKYIRYFNICYAFKKIHAH